MLDQTSQNQQLIDNVIIDNNNSRMSISAIKDAIYQKYGVDLTYAQIRYILSESDCRDNYVRTIGHPDTYQIESDLYLRLTGISH